MRVACDLDNVVVDILDSARKAVAASASVEISEIVDTHIYWAPFHHHDEVIAQKLATPHEFWQCTTMLASAPPLPGAINALDRMARFGRLAGYVTRRAPSARTVTLEWIDRNKAPRAPLMMVGHEKSEDNHIACKADICLTIGATHLIDDSQEEAARALARGIIPILIDHPLGREKRYAWLAENPQVALARDITHAVEMLTSDMPLILQSA